MKYKVLGGKIGENILETVLYNRGIFDKNLFINPDNSSDSDLDLIINIDKGIKLIKDNLHKNILVLVDSDCDGITSGSIMYKYLKMINPGANISYYLHDGKKHGLTKEFMEYLGGEDVDLIIVPDAGSNDIENIEKIVKVYGADILIIDHHEIEKESKYGTIINNQICDNTNKNLTGAGMVLRFCEKLNEEYNFDIDELKNLAMLGLISDTADLTDNEVRNICLTSIKGIKNKFIKTFYEMKEKDLNNLTMKDLSFGGVIPLINAVLRVGTIEERIKLFETLADIVDEEKVTCIEKRKLNKETRKYERVPFYFNEYEVMVEECEKIKTRQNKLVEKTIKELEKEFCEFTGIQFFIVEADEEIKGITGLIAMKLAEKFSQPVIIAWLNEDGYYYGSLRGNEKVMPDFKAWCLDTGLFEWVQGHANAAGLCIDDINFAKLHDAATKVTPQEFIYEVDYEYNKILPLQDVLLIGRNKGLWGNGCKEPLFVIKDVIVPKMAIQHSKNTLRIWVNGVTYIKFRTPESEYEDLKFKCGFGETIKMNFMGNFSINEYMGKENPQVLITDYEVIKEEKEEVDIFAQAAATLAPKEQNIFSIFD